MIIVLSIGTTAIFYSAWYMDLPILSLNWFLYFLAWTPLIVMFISKYKYDQKRKRTLDKLENIEGNASIPNITRGN